MIRSIFFLLKLIALAAIIVWAIQNPGTAQFEWNGYTLTIHSGLAAAALILIITIFVMLDRIVGTITRMPQAIKDRRTIKSTQKGLTALAQGLNAIALGDARKTSLHARKAIKYLPNEKTLTTLLQSQADRLNSNTANEEEALQNLKDNKHVGFIARRALLQKAINDNKLPAARSLIDSSIKKYPESPWLKQVAYQIALKEKRWNDALDALKSLEKREILSREQIISDRTALFILQSEIAEKPGKYLQKAYAINPYFAPLIERIVMQDLTKNNRKKAVERIEKAWQYVPHPLLISLWDKVAPIKKKPKLTDRMQWFERLAKLNDSPASDHMLGDIARQENMLEEARTYLLKAKLRYADTSPASLFISLATLERDQYNDEDAAQEWLAQSREAQPDCTWICTQTSKPAQQWTPLSPLGLFNTLTWQSPHETLPLNTQAPAYLLPGML